MRDIAHDFFTTSPVMAAPLVALVLFVIVFVLVSLRAIRTQRSDADRAAQLALEGEEARDAK
jgi:hypothetical protein